jgi:hypothetical protein
MRADCLPVAGGWLQQLVEWRNCGKHADAYRGCRDAYSNSAANGNGHSHPDFNAKRNGHANADAIANSHSIQNANAHVHAESDSHRRV